MAGADLVTESHGYLSKRRLTIVAGILGALWFVEGTA